MAITLAVKLTDAQESLLLQAAADALPAGSNRGAQIAWATQVATDGVAAEVERIGVDGIDTEAREAQNTARRTFIKSVKDAWATTE